MSPKPLSPTQTALLLRLHRTPTPLVRLPGGFWTAPNTPMMKAPMDSPAAGGTVPIWHYPTQTVRALLERKLLCALTQSRFGPTKVELTEAGAQACDRLARNVGVDELKIQRCTIGLE